MNKGGNDRAEKVEALHAELREEIARLQTSEDWRRALDFYASFYRYSFGNSMLIALQGAARGFAPTAVAGFNAWKKKGRNVRKGEKGLAIFAPLVRVFEDEKTGEKMRALRGFRLAYVFDVSQTDGPELPSDIMMPKLLQGDTDGTVWKMLAGFARAQGVSVEIGNALGANGYFNPETRVIVVERERERAQQEKTLAHEIAHALLHADADAYGCRGTMEVEAESVAYVVMRALGRDVSGYSLPYIAGWGGRDADAVEKTMGRVTSAAKKILAVFDAADEEEDAA